MDHALRPYATAGIALVGASMIAVAPLTTPMPDNHVTSDVQLTAIDFTGAWEDAFNTAVTNVENLQTAAQDASTALTEALGQADFGDLNFEELGAALTFLAGDQKTFLNPLTHWTLNGAGPDGDATVDATHALLYAILTNQASVLSPELFPPLPPEIPQIVNFLSSPLSGLLIGALSPSIAPWVALGNSIEAISENLFGQNPDTDAALQELVNIPANMVNGLLNGATLNLDALVPAINDAGLPLPPGVEIGSLSFEFGGLLNPGLVGGDPTDLNTLGDAIPGGGSIFNALGLGLNITEPLELNLTILPHGVGLAGAMVGLEQVIAEWLGGDLIFAPPPDEEMAAGAAAVADSLSGLLGDLFGAL
ncbi:hypothetical protein MSP7336_00165 [Mycobacterium shimoidei]|uniref:PE-PGRS family protein n=1 Tax=Mycobacterium shimoidei TaxID=29313 RepID=A0A375YSQ8_MYCSH|nr:outer membrane porin GjpA [Mycobacterium shimoidei]SRX91944.1 hypothetical protein MSP7336_00165 [Mycobacterium shimoidei]